MLDSSQYKKLTKKELKDGVLLSSGILDARTNVDMSAFALGANGQVYDPPRLIASGDHIRKTLPRGTVVGFVGSEDVFLWERKSNVRKQSGEVFTRLDNNLMESGNALEIRKAVRQMEIEAREARLTQERILRAQRKAVREDEKLQKMLADEEAEAAKKAADEEAEKERLEKEAKAAEAS